MAQSYTRQSTFADGDTITAALFNNEYNQLVNAFSYSSTSVATTGHRHDGTAGEGGNIHTIGDLDFLNKIVVDSTNNRWGFYVEVSSAAVEQIRLQDGALIPVTDSDVDLGTSSLYFKDAYIDSVTTTGNVSVGGNLTVTGNATISGNLTFGDADTDSINLAAEIDSNIVPNTDDTYDLGTATKQWRNLYIDGTAEIDTLAINGTTLTATAAELNTLDGITSTVAELNILDGVTATATEINLLDGITEIDTDISSVAATDTTLASAKAIKTYVDAQVTAQDLDFQADTGGALNIDLDSETLTFTGGTGIDTSGATNTVTFAIDSTVATLTGTQTLTNKTLTTPVISSISNTGTIVLPTSSDTLVGRATTDTLTNKTINADDNTLSNIEVDNFKASAIVIESEGIGSNNNDTTLPTSAAVKDYVDTQITADDLDLQGDSGGALSIDLDSETLIIAGGSGIDTAGASKTITITIDSTVATLTGTQTLTNKTLTSPDINTPDIDGGTIDAAVIGGVTPAAITGTTINGTAITGTSFVIGSATITEAELEILDGATVTTSELNILDGVTSTAAEINLLDGSTANTVVNNKAVIYGSSGELAGTLSTAAQPNITSVGTLSNLSVGSTITINNTTASSFGTIEISGTSGAYVDLKSPSSDDFDLRIITSGTGGQINAASGTLALQIAGSNILSTSSTGVNITGTATADNLTVDGNGSLLTFDNGSNPATISNTNGNITTDFDTTNAGRNYTIQANSINAFRIANGGDISFYEDTGTSAALYWDASAESLGIGTTSVGTPLHVKDSGNSIIKVESTTANANVVFRDGTATADVTVGSVDNGEFRIQVNNSERLRIDGSGNVGIGTDSPDNELHISDSTGNAVVQIEASATGFSQISFGDINDGDVGKVKYDHSDNSMSFTTSTSEAMRIDSSGNLFVNQTATSDYTNTVGSSFRATGFSTHTRDAEAALLLNRLTDDGHILIFRKDNSTVGSIGSGVGDSSASTLYIADAGNVGIRFDQAATDDIQPCNSSGADRDDAINLGASDNRFKDLYLSGAANVNSVDASAGIASTALMNVKADGTNDTVINVGLNTASNHYSYIDLIGDSTYTDYGLRIIRNNTGANTSSGIHHRGTGELFFRTDDNADMKFETNGSEAMRIDSSGRLLIGHTSTVIPTTGVNPFIQNTGTNASQSSMSLNRFSNDANGSFFYFVKSRGTTAGANGVVSSSDVIGKIEWRANDGTDNLNQVARIEARIDGAAGTDDTPGRIQFFTTADGSNTSSERMRIDSSGNVGISQNSPAALLHIGDSTNSLGGTAGDQLSVLTLESDTTNTDSLLFTTERLSTGTTWTSAAHRIQRKVDASKMGYIQFGANTSDLITFGKTSTEYVRIDGDGNLGIGETSPEANLHVKNASAGTFTASNSQLLIENNTTVRLTMVSPAANACSIEFGDIDDQNVGVITYDHSGNYMNFKTNAADAMRIDSRGGVVIGDTSIPQYTNLKVYQEHFGGMVNIGHSNTGGTFPKVSAIGMGSDAVSFGHSTNNGTVNLSGSAQIAAIQTASSGAVTEMAFYTTTGGSVTERMRIDSSGNLLLGGTSQLGKFTCHNGGSDGVYVNGTGTGYVYRTSNTTGLAGYFVTSSGAAGSISVSGTSTTYNTSSDARLKDVTGSARGLEVINELNPVSYNWKADGKADEGLIAQEVKEIVPNAVSGSEEDMYQMDYSKLVVHLVKAVKEQQTQIEALQSEINLLKGE